MPLMKEVVGTAATLRSMLRRLHSDLWWTRPGCLSNPSDVAVCAHDAGKEYALQHRMSVQAEAAECSCVS